MNAPGLTIGGTVRLRGNVGPLLKFIYRDETGVAGSRPSRSSSAETTVGGGALMY